MKFNESKYSVLHNGKDNPKSNYTMGRTPLQVVDKEKDLGVVVSAGDTLLLGGTYSRNDWESKTNNIMDH